MRPDQPRPPRVTVVVPCHNYGRYLPACVDSVLSQAGVDVDVLIVDDASTDASPEVARALAGADPRVTVVQHSRNAGHIATYNEGLGMATGTYVVLLSADDLLVPGSLARATAVMEANPRVGLVYGNPVVFHGDDPPPARTRSRGVCIWRGSEWISRQCRRGLSCIYCPEAVVRTSVQHAVGGYDAALPHTADLDMWLRIAAVADVARVNGSDQAYRRMHAESMMQTAYAREIEDLRGRRDAYEAFFAGAGAGLATAQRDTAVVRRRLAAEALDHACTILRGAPPDAEQSAEYVAFAVETLGDDVTRLRQWHEHRMLSGQASARRDVALRWAAVRRDLEGRYRWRRWRWIGV